LDVGGPRSCRGVCNDGQPSPGFENAVAGHMLCLYVDLSVACHGFLFGVTLISALPVCISVPRTTEISPLYVPVLDSFHFS